MGEDGTRADALAATALLNCLIRELAQPADGAYLLPVSGQRLRVAGHGRWPADPALSTPDGWQPLALAELVALTEQELKARTGVANATLAAEIADSRDVIAALLAAREQLRPPADANLRSEQALLAGHRYHPAAKTRGGGPPSSWLPYAPEAYAAFPLTLLGVREDLLAGEGDTGVLDVLRGAAAPEGYRLLPAHPWQLRLLGDHPALHDGRLRLLGETTERGWATSSLRTVYLPDSDLFLKFSLEVRITNDVRRLWLRDLRWLAPVDELMAKTFADAPEGASMLADRGYRTADLGGEDAYEAFAVLLRDGFGTAPGAGGDLGADLGAGLGAGRRPLLAAGISEGFPGNPLDGLTADQARSWWRRYVERIARPVLHAFFRHGVVLECHLQNVLVAMDRSGLPARAVFRDHEGVKLLTERHAGLLAVFGPDVPTPGVPAAYGWQRLVYCLVTNNLLEIAGAVTERHPGLSAELWPLARTVFEDYADQPEVRGLLASPTVPAKTNLLLRWLDADGGDSTYTPLANPLFSGCG
ncbi:siderophore synthetase component [Streptacidiphilus sp. MAP12-16]|uniref:IucA/IucC family protein n=1 Tax=Streptacidiphilus sp. MAP12-16 TaxID=3156300 RepID=UPI0035163FD4